MQIVIIVANRPNRMVASVGVGNNTKDNNYGFKEERFSKIRLLGISWLTNALVPPRRNIRQLARIFRQRDQTSILY